jgi:hypothetical protein
MILQCDYADESCGLPGDEGTIGKECGESAEMIAGSSPLPEGGLFTAKGKMVISIVGPHSENDSNRTGSSRRRSGLWIHLDLSYG